MSMEPTVLAWLTAGIAVPAAALVFTLGYVSRAASTAVGLISVLALLALAAASFIIGIMAVQYYMEISKREGHE